MVGSRLSEKAMKLEDDKLSYKCCCSSCGERTNYIKDLEMRLVGLESDNQEICNALRITRLNEVDMKEKWLNEYELKVKHEQMRDHKRCFTRPGIGYVGLLSKKEVRNSKDPAISEARVQVLQGHMRYQLRKRYPLTNDHKAYNIWLKRKKNLNL